MHLEMLMWSTAPFLLCCFLRSINASYIDIDPVPKLVQTYIDLGKGIKVYVPPEYFKFTGQKWKVPDYISYPVNTKHTDHLMPLGQWLYNHDEYQTEPHYIKCRLQQDKNLFTANIDEAQLCYPR